MRNFLDHPPEDRRIRPLHHLVELPQTEPFDNPLMFFGRANRAAHELDFDRPRHHSFSTASPRDSATAFRSRSNSSATIVAFTTLCGLRRPIDFVRTFGMPHAEITARTAPPAITPVPSGAGFNKTCELANWPSTRCGIVVSSTFTLRRLFLAASMPFRMAEGTSFALPTPYPTTFADGSPITTSAEKLRFLPPFTTLVTRLIETTCSFRFSGPGSMRFTIAIWLELQSRGARRVRQRLDAPVVLIAAAVEHHFGNALLLGAFRHQLANHLRRRHVPAASLARFRLRPFGRLPYGVFVHRRGRHQ